MKALPIQQLSLVLSVTQAPPNICIYTNKWEKVYRNSVLKSVSLLRLLTDPLKVYKHAQKLLNPAISVKTITHAHSISEKLLTINNCCLLKEFKHRV